jgi:clan AA aspartic protease (TIGR02281 family)
MLLSYRLLTFFAVYLLCLQLSAQTIKMEKKGGVYYVPCKVNGLGLNFIFDTGASDVSISSAEAVFMLKNGYMNEVDLGGSEFYRLANGDIAEGTKVLLRKIEIGDKVLTNIEASIVHSIEAPLLLGQSLMEKLGQFTIDYASNSLIIEKGVGTSVSNGGGSKQTNISRNASSASKSSVKIGKQEWMTKNLDVDKFRNGQNILNAKTDAEWISAGENRQSAWCYYNNDSSNAEKYGKLYNWYAVADSRGLCPAGWHLPSDEEWTVLIDHLGGEKIAGIKMKSISGWYDNGNGTNISDFNGLPGGIRSNYKGYFQNVGGFGGWYSSTEASATFAWYCYLSYGSGSATRNIMNKLFGFSVRCLKD